MISDGLVINLWLEKENLELNCSRDRILIFGHLGISSAQQSCVPATALVSWLRLNRLGTDFVLVVLGTNKILPFEGPEIQKTDFWWSGDRQY